MISQGTSLFGSGSCLVAMADALKRSGKSPTALARELGLSAESVVDPGTRSRIDGVRRGWEWTGEAVGVKPIGLHAASLRSTGAAGLMEYLAVSGPNAFWALDVVARYANLQLDLARASVQTEDGALVLKHHVLFDFGDLVADGTDYLFGSILVEGQRLFGEDWKPTYVTLGHRDPKLHEQYRLFFGCEVRFGQDSDLMAFPSSLAEAKSQRHDTYLAQVLKRTAAEQSLALQKQSYLPNRVRTVIRETLDTGLRPNVDDIVKRLELPRRTLQHGLRKADLTMSQLVWEGVMVKARHLLSNSTKPLREIAYDVGYSDLGTFARAFKTFHGETAASYRVSQTLMLNG